MDGDTGHEKNVGMFKIEVRKDGTTGRDTKSSDWR